MQPILLYFANEDARAVELQKVVHAVVHNMSFTVLHEPRSLEYTLHHSLTTPPVILLSLANREDLLQIMILKEELMLSSLVVVLPNQAPDMITLAHRLRPRFVAFMDDDFTLIAEVLSRLIHEQDPNWKEPSSNQQGDIVSAAG